MTSRPVLLVFAAFTGLAAGILITLVAAGPAPVSPVYEAPVLPPHLLTPPPTEAPTEAPTATATPPPTPTRDYRNRPMPTPNVVTSTPMPSATPTKKAIGDW